MSNFSEVVFPILVDAAVKGTLVLGAAWLLNLALRGRSAASRHVIWTAAFAALLALPFLVISLPPLRIAGAPLLPNITFQATTTANPAVDPVEQQLLKSPRRAIPATPAPWRSNLRPWLSVLWSAGAAFALLQILVACIAMWRVRQAARTLDDPDLDGLAHTLNIAHSPQLFEARPGSMPMTFGLLRPSIFLPPDAANWTAERRRMVLLHELAHIQRGDVATHLIARAALALYWWNPLAWTAWRAFLKERERATDDLVLSAGARASDYAGHLLEVARTMQQTAAIGWAAVAMARPSQLEGRLLAILDARVNRKAPGRIVAAFASLLTVAAVAPLAAVQTQDPALPADIDATIRAANSQKNHDMLETAAKAAEIRKEFDVAQKLLDAAVNIRAQVSGERSAEYGVGLIKLGDLERHRNKRADADAFYTKAVGVLGNRVEAAPAFMHLGVDALANKNPEAAIDYFQQAQIADPSKAGLALMWMAIVRERQANFAEAESLYRGALAIQDINSTEAATTMELFADMLAQANRPEESASFHARANDIRKSNRPVIKPLETPAGVYRVGGGVSAPSLLYKHEPEYSEEARAAKYQGTVVLYVEIGPDGLAHNTRVTRSLGLGLDEKAIDAVSQWQFKPGVKDGVPVTVAATIEVNFRLL